MTDGSALRRVTIRNYTEFSKIIAQHLHSVKELPPPPDTFYDVGPRPKDIVISLCGFDYQTKKPPIHVDTGNNSQPLALPPSESRQRPAGKSKPGVSRGDITVTTWTGIKCPCGCVSMTNLTRTQRIRRKLCKGVCVYHYRKAFQSTAGTGTKPIESKEPSDGEGASGERHPFSYDWWYPLDPATVARQDELFLLTHSAVSKVYASLPASGYPAHETLDYSDECATITKPIQRNVGLFEQSIPKEHAKVYEKWLAMYKDGQSGFIYSHLIRTAQFGQSRVNSAAITVEEDNTRNVKDPRPLIDSTLRFESRFESGNLLQATRLPLCTEQDAPSSGSLPYLTEYIKNSNGAVAKYSASDQTYFLMLRPDSNSTGNTQWYYFAVGNTIPGIRYNFFIANFTKASSQYLDGMMPVVLSETERLLSGRGWERGGYDIDYYSNGQYLNPASPIPGAHEKTVEKEKASDYDNDDSQDDDSQSSSSATKLGMAAATEDKPVSCLLGSYYTLSFSYTFKYAGDIVYFAHTFPYTYEQAQLWINSLISKNLVERRNIDNRLNNALSKALMLTSETETGAGETALNRAYLLASAKAYYTYSLLKMNLLQRLAEFKNNPLYQRVASLLKIDDYQNTDIPILSHKVIGKSIGGNDIDLLTLTAPSSSTDELRKRKFIVISARIHPGEAQSSYVCQGIVDYLLSDDSIARLLRKIYIFKIVPMINPDGVVLGNYRCNLAGVDLNRRFIAPSMALHTCVYNFKKVLQSFMLNPCTDSAVSSNPNESKLREHHDDLCLAKTRDDDKLLKQEAILIDDDLSTKDLTTVNTSLARSAKQAVPPRPSTCKPSAKRRGAPFQTRSGISASTSSTNLSSSNLGNFSGASNPIIANFDLHGHSRKANTFGYACYGDSDEHLYFKALHRLSFYFNIKDCRYTVGKQKECTQRAVSYNQFHIKKSYCIESTFGGVTKAGSPKYNLQMCQRDFFNIGRDLSQGMLYLEPENLAAIYNFANENLVEFFSIVHNQQLKSFVQNWFCSDSILANKPAGQNTITLNDSVVYEEFCEWIHHNFKPPSSKRDEHGHQATASPPLTSAFKRGATKKKTVCFDDNLEAIAEPSTEPLPILEEHVPVHDLEAKNSCGCRPDIPQFGSTLSLPYFYTEKELNQDLYLLEQVKSLTGALIDPSLLCAPIPKPSKPDQDGHSSDDDVQVELINLNKPKPQRKKSVSTASNIQNTSAEGVEQLTRDIIAAQSDEAQLENALEREIIISDTTEKSNIGISVKRYGKTIFRSLPLRTLSSEDSVPPENSSEKLGTDDTKDNSVKQRPKGTSQSTTRRQNKSQQKDNRTESSTGQTTGRHGSRLLDGSAGSSDGALLTEGFKTSWGGGAERGSRKNVQGDIFSRLAKNPYKVLPEKREYMQEAMQATSRLATYSIVTHTVDDLPVDRNAANIANKLQKNLTSSRVWDDTRTQQTNGIPASSSFTGSKNGFTVLRERDFGELNEETDIGPYITPRRPGSSQRTAVSSSGWHANALQSSQGRLVSIPQLTERIRTAGKPPI